MFKKTTNNYEAFKRGSLYLLLFSFVLISGCESKFDEYWQAENPKGGLIYTRLKDDPQFSTFARGLDLTNLTRFVDRSGLYTVFAPTNEAFDAYLKSKGHSSLEDIELQELTTILSYHIVYGMYYNHEFKKQFKDSKRDIFATRNKKFVTVDVRGDAFAVNGIPVINTLRDLDAENGVIHGIGQVMVPLQNVELTLRNDPRFDTFYKLLQPMADERYDNVNSFDNNRDGQIDSLFIRTYERLITGLAGPAVEYVQGGNFGFIPVNYTVLAPSNDVLNAYLAPILPKFGNSIDNLPPYFVENLIEPYFIFGSAITSKELIDRPVKITALGGDVPPLTEADFLYKDVKASNGIIHGLNTLFPIASRLRGGIGVAMTDPDLTSFIYALEKANLLGTYISPTKAATYFAPTNAAFQAAGLMIYPDKTKDDVTLNGVTLNDQQLGNILKHHIHNADRARTSLTNGALATDYAGNSLTVKDNGNKVESTSGVTANLVGGQIKGLELPNDRGVIIKYNGFVHKVDALLLPAVY